MDNRCAGNFQKEIGFHLKLGGCGQAVILFLTAFLYRSFFGYLFFGSEDVIHSIENSKLIFEGARPDLPYFPVIPVFIWVGGLLSAWRHLPIAFCYKLIPIFFDSMIGVLIYKVLRQTQPDRQAFKIAFLYVFCPVALLINSFQGQWDSIFLFYLIIAFYVREFYKQSKINAYLSGIFYAFSIAVKPVAIIFATFFFARGGYTKHASEKENRKTAFFTALGFGGFWLFYLSALLWKRYDLASLIGRILSYAKHGAIIYGLPMAPPFNQWPFFREHLWLLIPLIFIAIAYRYGRFQAFEAMLVGFLVILAFSIISPQYLLWPMPFFLLVKRLKEAVIYGCMVSFILIGLYSNHFIPLWDRPSLGPFSFLKQCTLFGAADPKAREVWMNLFFVLGYYPFSVNALGVIYNSFRHHSDLSSDLLAGMKKQICDSRAYCDRVCQIGLISMLLAIIAFTMMGASRNFADVFYETACSKMQAYVPLNGSAIGQSDVKIQPEMCVAILSLIWGFSFLGFKKKLEDEP